jgi:NADH-quinone oxidoreductase subunit C
MSWRDRVVEAVTTASAGDAPELVEEFAPLTVDVAPHRWVASATALRDAAGCTYFDWLSAVDELDDGFRIVCHLAALGPSDGAGGVDHVLLRTLLPRDQARVHTLVNVYAGAAWHERETHEMFGVEFAGGPGEPLLLPDGFEGHPLRKDFYLVSRVVKDWPGRKEPGESDADTAAPSRRRVRPPGLPDPVEWGPRDPEGAEREELSAPSRPPGRLRADNSEESGGDG